MVIGARRGRQLFGLPPAVGTSQRLLLFFSVARSSSRHHVDDERAIGRELGIGHALDASKSSTVIGRPAANSGEAAIDHDQNRQEQVAWSRS